MTQTQIELARKHIAGGVNSPVRAFKEVGIDPFFTKEALGAIIKTSENKELIDYVCSWGAVILGHAHQKTINAVKESVNKGLSFGTITEQETQLALLIKEFLPSIEKIRLVNSGTEATMSAIRLARGFTNRNIIVKFEGCYHGHSDSLLVQAGSSVINTKPTSQGIPEEFTKNTIVARYNDSENIKEIFEKKGDQIAAVIIEPIAGNMNLVVPSLNFINNVKNLCDKYQSLLIYDEVMTGFRVEKGGAQQIQNIKPDITTIGKVAGGGMPLAAFGGKKEIMDFLAPLGNVYQAGTLAGNPISVAAGIATLKSIKEEPDFYKKLSDQAGKLVKGIREIAKNKNFPLCAQNVGGMIGIYFLESIPSSFDEVKKSNSDHFVQFFRSLLDEGVFIAPSKFESSFITFSHTDEIIEKSLKAVEKAISKIK